MRIRCLAAVLACLPAATAWAQPASGCAVSAHEATTQPIPTVQQLGTVRFITGGIGIDEARAMRAERLHYSLALTFALRSDGKDSFLSGVQVEIRDADGRPLLCTTSDGPYLFVDLPPGRYQVSATTGGGRQMERRVTVPSGGHQDFAFVWPASASVQ